MGRAFTEWNHVMAEHDDTTGKESFFEEAEVNAEAGEGKNSGKPDFWEDEIEEIVSQPEPLAAEATTEPDLVPETTDAGFLGTSMAEELLATGHEKTEQIDLQSEPDLSELHSSVDSDDGEGEPSYLEMRQIAGLSAGSSMRLTHGTYKFKDAFSLNVSEDGRVTVLPGNSDIRVNDVKVVQPTSLGNSILNVGSARFTVLPPRPDDPYAQEIEPNERSIITVPDFPLTKAQKSTWFAKSQTPDASLDTLSWEFIQEIRANRDEDARLHRLLHPDPEELAYRIRAGQKRVLNRDHNHTYFGRFSIAYGPIPWTPRFDRPEAIPSQLGTKIQELRTLASVPITHNILSGPLAIVGPRQAALASARHCILSLAALSKPGDIELKVITTDKHRNQDWGWITELPSWVSARDNTYRTVIADGMRNFELAGLNHRDAEANNIGLIIVAESVKDIPAYTSVVLQVSDSGLSKATNQRQESIEGTPIGIKEKHAKELAAKLHNFPA